MKRPARGLRQHRARPEDAALAPAHLGGGRVADPRGDGAYREGLEHTIEKADELIKTFNALLLVARLEAGVLEENAEQFDLGASLYATSPSSTSRSPRSAG